MARALDLANLIPLALAAGVVAFVLSRQRKAPPTLETHPSPEPAPPIQPGPPTSPIQPGAPRGDITPREIVADPPVGSRLRIHPYYASVASPPVVVDPSASAVIMVVEQATRETISGRLVAIENSPPEGARFEAPLQAWPERRITVRRDGFPPIFAAVGGFQARHPQFLRR